MHEYELGRLMSSSSEALTRLSERTPRRKANSNYKQVARSVLIMTRKVLENQDRLFYSTKQRGLYKQIIYSPQGTILTSKEQDVLQD